MLKHQQGSYFSLHTTAKVSGWVLLSSSEGLRGSPVVERWFLVEWTVLSVGSNKLSHNPGELSADVLLRVLLTNLKSDF